MSVGGGGGGGGVHEDLSKPKMDNETPYGKGAQSCSWRSTFLQSSAPNLINHTWGLYHDGR